MTSRFYSFALRAIVHSTILALSILWSALASAQVMAQVISLALKIALAWISTQRNSPHTRSLESTISRVFRSEIAVTCYARWCADSLVARRHFALSRLDFRGFRTSVGKVTPGRVAISAPLSLTQMSELPSLMNPLLTQMLGESASVEIQASKCVADRDSGDRFL